ncbi:hypothetical protein DSL64_02620 [Dyadobacter luteus]|uniref:Uncharacterized protein n=1 Tax=Dyadobacter luteus TaxID=2259619 RepID=A0A3D8YIH7_9BACT|nr:hypothetical protein DSL64_02620 [Dyadobacter luteus]
MGKSIAGLTDAVSIIVYMLFLVDSAYGYALWSLFARRPVAKRFKAEPVIRRPLIADSKSV